MSFIEKKIEPFEVDAYQGFTVNNFESWGPFILALTFVLMFFGACAGSTSGGAKIDRILYLFKNSKNELYRCLYPNAVLSVKVNGRVVNPDLVSKVIAFLCIYMLLIVGGGMSLTLFDVPIVDAFFSSFSCLSNTGLGAGVTGYGNSYDILPDAAKYSDAVVVIVNDLGLSFEEIHNIHWFAFIVFLDVAIFVV